MFDMFSIPVKKGQSGFTLIELLVVIAIIGILSSVIIMAVQDARKKSKNSARTALAGEYIKAIEMYYADYGRYPNVNLRCLGDYSDGRCWQYSAANNNQGVYLEEPILIANLAPYISNPPGDVVTVPSQTGATPRYYEGLTYQQLQSASQFRIQWILEGINQSCGRGAADSSLNGAQWDGTLCVYTSS